MISVGTPFIYIKDGKAYLKASVKISQDTANAYKALKDNMHKVHWRVNENYPPIEWNQENSGLWFAVDENYGEYLCTETADAFVVAMLWYAMATGSDISSDAPVSENLLFSVNNYLVPALCTRKNGRRRISVSAPVSKMQFPNMNGVGTGMSCGIDSLYTLKRYSGSIADSRKLTHLTYFNMGAVFHPDSSKNTIYSIPEFYRRTDEISKEKIEQAAEVARIAGLPLVYVSSNLDSDYYRGAYGYTAVYRNCACVLALQKLFSMYYCSSAGWPGFFDLSIDEGSEHYEDLLCQCFSTENCRFVLSDYATRIEKTEYLADWDVAWHYLDVCFNFNNCGHCAKCYRVLITLDILGCMDRFDGVFDIEEYKRNRMKAYAWLLYTKNKDAKDDNAIFARDLYDYFEEKHRQIPAKAYYELAKLYLRDFKRNVKKLLSI